LDDRLWRRADELLAEALELPPEERTSFVARAAAGDSELAVLVRRLLNHAGAGESEVAPGLRLSASPGRDLLDGAAEEAAAPAGAVVGRYRLLGELGRGGMAVVYRAERVDGDFEQQVALKQIRLGFDSDEVVRRFERERQILARATHPDVARLLDGGVGPDGRPFLVMELVEGVPIDQYCDEKRLTVRERLGLFLRVARAVEYAHRNLVVHRDLKPSNILVTADGHPKLLDFGIAGLLAGPEADAGLTRHDLRPMTPAYASPEQTRGEPVTTLSDVYQLGLLLYLLLTGRIPYRKESSSTPLALARAISEEPPARPAEALRRPPGAAAGPGSPAPAEEVARLRRTSPARLARLLDGDLGSIVLMALRKEPERRYSSVALLAEDVERYLAGRTVAARPDSLWYRGRRFALRHRVAVLFAGLLFAALVAFGATAAVQARRVAAERDRANREAEIAGEVSRFLTELFKVSDPGEAQGNTVTAREILDRGSAEIDRRLPRPSLVRARLQRTMGEVYENLGLYAQAQPLFERAASTAIEAAGERHLETVAARADLGRLFLRMGRYDEAEKLLRPALEARRAALGEEHPEVLDVTGNLAALSLYQGRGEEAVALSRQALEARRRVQGSAHLDTLGAANNLATALFSLGRLGEAEALYREVLSGLRRGLGPDHPRTLAAASNLGSIWIQLGRLGEAEPLLRDTIERRRRVLGEAHPATLTAESNLAGLLDDSGRLAEAEALHRRVHEGRRAALGAEHPRTLDALLDVASLVARDPARRKLLDDAEFSALAGRPDFEELRRKQGS
jgi:serine/threonine-protein kinase